jgi:microcystin-dependent protein
MTRIDCETYWPDGDPEDEKCEPIEILYNRARDLINAICNLSVTIPTGLIVAYAGPEAADPPDYDGIPTGWLLCDGSEVSRTTYVSLFQAIGITYGAGDTTTTFNLPDLRGRRPLGADNMGGSSANRITAAEADNLGQGSGAESHVLVSGEMPSHNHPITGYVGSGSGGADWQLRITDGQVPASGFISTSTGGGGAHNNMQPYLTMNYIIKS